MHPTIARIGAAAGWTALVLIFGYHLAVQAVAGTRVSGTLDPSAISAYYHNEILAPASIAQIIVLPVMLVFVLALRAAASRNGELPRFLATIGTGLVIAELAVLLTEVSVQAALVAVARSGGDTVGMFRFWDVLYNSGTYVLEAGLLASFGLALRGDRAFPRWLPTFALAAAALQLVNMTAIWVGIPDAATMVGNVAFAVWFGGSSVGLGRLARASRPMLAAQPA